MAELSDEDARVQALVDRLFEEGRDDCAAEIQGPPLFHTSSQC